jgi:hypothetical protein
MVNRALTEYNLDAPPFQPLFLCVESEKEHENPQPG